MEIHEIKAKAEEFIERINVSKKLLPGFEETVDGWPLVCLQGGIYNYAFYERGELLETKSTKDPDELLFWIFESITFELAIKYELLNRVKDQDCRRIIFEKQKELMLQLNPKWHNAISKQHAEILFSYPFHDGD